MATKEDILEQIVEEYLVHKGYFVQHNIKFRPSKNHPKFNTRQDSNHSDIDVIGYHPRKESASKKLWLSAARAGNKDSIPLLKSRLLKKTRFEVVEGAGKLSVN